MLYELQRQVSLFTALKKILGSPPAWSLLGLFSDFSQKYSLLYLVFFILLCHFDRILLFLFAFV